MKLFLISIIIAACGETEPISPPLNIATTTKHSETAAAQMGPRLPKGVDSLPSYVVAEEWKASLENDYPLGYTESFRAPYSYTTSSVDDPVSIGFFHGGRCHHFYRAYLSDSFDRAGVNTQLYTSFLNDPYRFEPVSRNFEREYARRAKERMGRVTGTVLTTMITLGELDGAIIGEASAIMAAKQGLPIVNVARLGHGDRDVSGFMIVMRNGLNAKTAEDLRGKTVSTRRAGPGDEVLLREYFHQAGMEAGKDYEIVAQTNDDQQHHWLKDGAIDAGLYHMYGVSKQIAAGKVDLMRPMDWVPGDLPAAYLAFHKDFVRDRPDDVLRILRGLMWRLEYEKTLPSSVQKANRQFGYVLEYFFRGTRLPHTTFPFTAERNHLQQMQDMMLRHGAMDSPVDLEPYLADGLFDQTLIDEHAAGSIFPPEAPMADFANARLQVDSGKIDMAMGLDDSVAPGVIIRKMEESGVRAGLLYDRVQSPRRTWGDMLAKMYPQQFVRTQSSPIRLKVQPRTWAQLPDTPHNTKEIKKTITAAKSSGLPVWVRDENSTHQMSAEFSALLRAHPEQSFIWLHGGFAQAAAVSDALNAHPNLYVGLSGLEPEQDLQTPATTQTKQAWSVKAKKKGYEAKANRKWIHAVSKHPTRFVYASDVFSSFQYEIHYQKGATGMDALMAMVKPDNADRIGRTNALALLSGERPL
jgi:ABC-type nitrate/sulfonate/bicarbonate transport system substrate-binding protein